MAISETIVAVATAEGRSGIGVVRLSGPAVGCLIREIIGTSLPPRQATLCRFQTTDRQAIDQGIAIYFPAPHSYTGEDVLELQGHGNPLLLQVLVRRCIDLGARLAEPGEFTRRAFLNDKLDLAQAEAVADLIEASTERAALSAVHSLQGAFSRRIGGLASELVELRALVEAALDFPEEEPEPASRAEIGERIARLCMEVSSVLALSRQGALLREGVSVVLAGPPNVGKSSLLNRLAGDDLAIVTPVPGTTRDPIRARIDIGGVPMNFVDTAGLRLSVDPVERLGIERTREAVVRAHVVVSIVDATAVDAGGDIRLLAPYSPSARRIQVVNKIDLAGCAPAVTEEAGVPTVWLSALTGSGVELLERELLKAVGWQSASEGVFMARARHLEALQRALVHLDSAREWNKPAEFVAEDLRLAQEVLGVITGRVTSDELLGEIFSRFCLGK